VAGQAVFEAAPATARSKGAPAGFDCLRDKPAAPLGAGAQGASRLLHGRFSSSRRRNEQQVAEAAPAPPEGLSDAATPERIQICHRFCVAQSPVSAEAASGVPAAMVGRAVAASTVCHCGAAGIPDARLLGGGLNPAGLQRPQGQGFLGGPWPPHDPWQFGFPHSLKRFHRPDPTDSSAQLRIR